MLRLGTRGSQLPLGVALDIVFEQPEPRVTRPAAQVESVGIVRQRHHVARLAEGETASLRQGLETIGCCLAGYARQQAACDQQDARAKRTRDHVLCPVFLLSRSDKAHPWRPVAPGQTALAFEATGRLTTTVAGS